MLSVLYFTQAIVGKARVYLVRSQWLTVRSYNTLLVQVPWGVANTRTDAIPDAVHTEPVGCSLGISARTGACLGRSIRTCVPRAAQRSYIYYMHVEFS